LAIHEFYQPDRRTGSETESKLSLQLTMQIALAADQAEVCRRRSGDIQRRSVGFRVVQNVGSIQPELQSLGFRETDGLAEIHIETPSSGSGDRPETHGWHGAGPGVLQKN